jgi:hypothetical protein
MITIITIDETTVGQDRAERRTFPATLHKSQGLAELQGRRGRRRVPDSS